MTGAGRIYIFRHCQPVHWFRSYFVGFAMVEWMVPKRYRTVPWSFIEWREAEESYIFSVFLSSDHSRKLSGNSLATNNIFCMPAFAIFLTTFSKNIKNPEKYWNLKWWMEGTERYRGVNLKFPQICSFAKLFWNDSAIEQILLDGEKRPVVFEVTNDFSEWSVFTRSIAIPPDIIGWIRWTFTIPEIIKMILQRSDLIRSAAICLSILNFPSANWFLCVLTGSGRLQS